MKEVIKSLLKREHVDFKDLAVAILDLSIVFALALGIIIGILISKLF